MWMEKNQCCQSGSALLQASNVVQTNMLIYATLHLYEQSLFSEQHSRGHYMGTRSEKYSMDSCISIRTKGNTRSGTSGLHQQLATSKGAKSSKS